MTGVIRRLHGDPQPPTVGPPNRPDALRRLVIQADPDQRLWARLVAVWLVTPVVAATGLVVGGLVFAVMVAVVGVSIPPAVLIGRRRALARAQVLAAPDLLLAVARHLRSGGAPASALAAISARAPAAVAPLVRRAAVAFELGASVDQALDELVVGNPPDELRSARLALGLALGGAQASDALEAAAASLVAAGQLEAEVSALTAQVRLSARVLVLLPVGFVALGGLVGADQVTLLVTSSTGLVCLIAGAVLDIVGWGWLKFLTTRVAR